MNKELNDAVITDETSLSDADLEPVSGGLLWLVVVGFVVGHEIFNAITGDTRKAH